MIDKAHNSTKRTVIWPAQSIATQSLIGGEWRPGEMIPSEIDLRRVIKYRVTTVRKAIDSLAENILNSPSRQGHV
jgi:GntR family transcriptional regulator